MNRTAPAETGRVLVPLYVVVTHSVMINAQQIEGYTPNPNAYPLDSMYHKGRILPAGVKQEVLDHLVRTGMVSRVLVRVPAPEGA